MTTVAQELALSNRDPSITEELKKTFVQCCGDSVGISGSGKTISVS